MAFFDVKAVKSAAMPRFAHRTVVRATLWMGFAALLAWACWCRLYRLERLPGLNGDEAWYGAQWQRIRAGEHFAWRTPTGNVLNFCYFAPLAVAETLWPRTVWALRLPAVASGLAALVLSWFWARRLWGSAFAAALTLALAVLPVNIAYSRFGWDASQTLGATLLVFFISAELERQASRRWLVFGIVALLVALWIHPTNVFIAPCFLIAARPQFARAIESVWGAANRTTARRTTAIVLFAAIGVAATWAAGDWLNRAIRRAVVGEQYASFAVRYVELFSGTTVYRFIPGWQASQGAGVEEWSGTGANVLAALFLFGGATGLFVRRGGLASASDRTLALGYAVSILGFFLIAGPEAMEPHYERYSLCLVGPATALCLRGWQHWLGQGTSEDVVPRWGALGLAAAGALLIGFESRYFAPLESIGGESHRSLRTAEIEPKLATWRWVRAQPWAQQPFTIVADEWWLYWPICYFATHEANARIVTSWHEVPLESLANAHEVRFADHTPEDPNGVPERVEFFVRDASGRPLIWVLRRAQRPEVRYNRHDAQRNDEGSAEDRESFSEKLNPGV